MHSQRLRRVRAPAELTDLAMPTAYEFSFSRLNAPGELALRELEGRALMVVNVASACGYTSQYAGLQKLWEAKAGAGLTLIGAPCNDFGAQEKGSEAAIQGFCDQTYHVTFPMTGKIEIVGAGRHPFYAWVAQELGEEALPRWNFHKYLIDRRGALVGSFPASVTPLAPEMLGAVSKALAC